jgi:hypothetical protein
LSLFSSSRDLKNLDIDGRRATALVTLSSQDLVVVVSEVHAGLSPSIEVVLHVDGAAGALVAADRPVLVESLSTVDGRLLVTGGHVEIVGVTVGVDSTSVLSLATGVVRAVALNDVVLDERAASPAVNAKVSVALRVEGTSVVDGSASTRVPSLSTNKVTSVAPINLVVAALTHAVLSITTTIRPPRIEVAIVVAFTVASDLTGLKDGGGVAIVALIEEVKGTSKCPSECRDGNEKGFERDHDGDRQESSSQWKCPETSCSMWLTVQRG